jgi:hypothetical protein
VTATGQPHLEGLCQLIIPQQVGKGLKVQLSSKAKQLILLLQLAATHPSPSAAKLHPLAQLHR